MNIITFLQELDRKQFFIAFGAFFGILIATLGTILFFQQRYLSGLVTRLERINNQRTEVRSLLEEHGLVKQQRSLVEGLIAQDPNFKIAQYFEQLIKELRLEPFLSTKVPPVSENDLNNGYIEKQLEVGFKNIDMKQVVDLLYKIEQNDRVYTKELILIKPPKTSKLDATLTIATLQPVGPAS